MRGGWWPYVLPILAFLILVDVSGRITDVASLTMLLARVAVPLAILVAFAFRGEYPEVKPKLTKMTCLDGIVGIVLAVMWIAPYILFPRLRPDLDALSFDPGMAGAALIPVVLTIRMIGYAIVTPWLEELFMRSFVIRVADVYETDQDFRSVPIGTFSWRSFITVIVVFLATHQVWEWWVMLPWAVLTNLWFYYRKDLFALMIVHAATNATILLAAIFLSDRFGDGAGGIIPLWFLV